MILINKSQPLNILNCLAQTTHSAKNNVMYCKWQEVTKELQFYSKEKRYSVWNSEQGNN